MVATCIPKFRKRFEALEGRRRALVDRVKALPADKQNTKPDPKSFSPTEVIMHMALAEQGNVIFLKKSPPSTLKGKKVHVTFIFRKTVSTMQNPAKPVATLSSMVPKDHVNLDEADRIWAELRKETATYLEEVDGPDDPFIKFLFFFGLASASQYFDLLESHMTYHEARFPKV